jgi:hypothetical protein
MKILKKRKEGFGDTGTVKLLDLKSFSIPFIYMLLRFCFEGMRENLTFC